MGIPPFGGAPTPIATPTRRGKVYSTQGNVPTLIGLGVIFVVAADTQVLFKAPCKLDGTVVIIGTRVNL